MNKKVLAILDKLIVPFVYPAAYLLRKVRSGGISNLPSCKNALLKVGVFPIRNHYYEPQFDFRNPRQRFSQDRVLPGIDWNVNEQLEMLNNFVFSQELVNIPQEEPAPLEFYLNNKGFKAGDAEYWYQLIRFFKPKRIFEIGSGYSTLMAIKAILKNMEMDPNYKCKHVCIEPYNKPWLEEFEVTVVRKKVEELTVSFFSELEQNDILFIDSSHIIRPQGDVLFEILEVLPTLNKGVIVHVHEIFTPKNYPRRWLEDRGLMWNEQYLLEAFLINNKEWKILGGVNYLFRNYYDKLKAVSPYLSPERLPASFYMQKIS